MPALRDLDLGDDTATAGPTSSTRRPTLYFAYGSNLWLAQMRRRCPSSVYLGVARLRSNGNGSHWRWVINERGYANVVEIPTPFSVATAHEGQEKEKDGDGDEDDESDVVYGIVYALPPAPSADEESLDAAEGVLVYVDRLRTAEGVAKEEYVGRMNEAVRDAVALGVPRGWVERCVRRFIPAE
ncbi:Aig2-like protein [Lasiodiplodia theobromae]|uniref:Aig2-like protein n=1 Tax=Lasiodiplodia theobromae TaxID=45133 RepID=UPI0015C2DC5C|nr:Aig2-like protein [Lasiodiplodia theobromae]KAF4541129.1 Aig2-like protein [Lasiodiplodia theobromae]